MMATVYVQYSTTIVDLRRCQVMLPYHVPGTSTLFPVQIETGSQTIQMTAA
jgi:hypothetical protein